VITGLSIVAGLCMAGAVLLSVFAYSLRNFTRSGLAAVANRSGREERFGEILRDDESALTACEILRAILFPLSVALFAVVRYGSVGDEIVDWRAAIDALLLVGFTVTMVMVVPWSVSRIAGERVIFRFWPLIVALTKATAPLTWYARRTDTLVHRISGRRDPEPETVETFTDEIQSIVDEGEREGLLESRAGRMIQRIMELREDDVQAVMTPRIDIVTIPSTASLQDARAVILQSGHSRVPVVGDTPDDVVGILYARDLLDVLHDRPDTELTKIVRHPHYVPETTTIDQLLERMKRDRFHIAIVLDEYGGVTGLVTMEDILEEIVGDIEDEFDAAQEEQVQQVDEITSDVDARMHIDDLNEMFDYTLPEDADYDTIGGFVFSELGRIPRRGESFTWKHLQITVLDVDKRKINKLRIRVDRSLQLAADDVS